LGCLICFGLIFVFSTREEKGESLLECREELDGTKELLSKLKQEVGASFIFFSWIEFKYSVHSGFRLEFVSTLSQALQG
jgi:hypothetical protein